VWNERKTKGTDRIYEREGRRVGGGGGDKRGKTEICREEEYKAYLPKAAFYLIVSIQ
jgi:hypothetical protein